MRRLVFILAAALAAINVSALPEWPRKYATSVIRGKVCNLPDSIKHVASIWGGASNVKEEPFPYDVKDSLGVFSMKWDMCWPMSFGLEICNCGLGLLLCPGDTIDVEMDYERYQEVKDDVERVFTEAVHIRGGFTQLTPEYRRLCQKLQFEASVIPTDYLKEHRDQSFEEYRERVWEKHLARLDAVMASSLQPEEKEHLRLEMETTYLRRVDSYDFFKKVIGCSKEEVEDFAAQKTLVDPHAESLAFPRSLTGAYYFGEEHLAYLRANGLDNLPLGRYLQEREKVSQIVARLKAFRPVSAETIDSLSPEFRQPLHELAKAAQDYADWIPTGDQSTWLRQIVNRHKGKVVFVDYWATWCGPCRTGIKEMSKVKDEYEKRGVDFVYITDSSSSTDGYLDLRKNHSGDHFIFQKSDIGKMSIPGYDGSIPHYIIYDRDGRLIKHITGWNSLEDMTQELDNALER